MHVHGETGVSTEPVVIILAGQCLTLPSSRILTTSGGPDPGREAYTPAYESPNGLGRGRRGGGKERGEVVGQVKTSKGYGLEGRSCWKMEKNGDIG